MSSAGELFVSIFGDSTKLDTTLKQIPAQAGAAGSSAGGQFAKNFTAPLNKFIPMVGRAVGVQLASSLASAAAEAIRANTNIGESLTNKMLAVVKGLPLVGGFVDLFQAIGEDLTGVLEQKRKQESLKKNIATMDKTLERRVADEKMFVSLSAQVAENTAKSVSNGAAAAKIKFNAARELERIERETADREKRGGKITDKEHGRLVELSNLREHLAAQEFGRALRAEEKLTGERLKAAKEVAEKAAKESRERMKEEREAREGAIKSVYDEYANIAIGESNTALGSFKFEAFPPDMQKMIQLRIAAAVEKLANQRMEAAGVY